MKRQGRSWLKQSILSLGLLGVAMPAVFAQEDPSKLTQPVMRVSKKRSRRSQQRSPPSRPSDSACTSVDRDDPA